MKIAYLAAFALGSAAAGCHHGGAGTGSGGAAKGEGPRAQDGFPATRWVPEKPTYVLSARTVREAQRGMKDALDSLGTIAGVGAGDLSRELALMIAIDPLSAEEVANAGVDLDGGIAVFSDALAPTFVVHLAAPDAASAWFDKQRERGLAVQSVVVDGIELFTATLPANIKASWAIDHDWLWVHFGRGKDADDRAWFAHSHHPGGGKWPATWSWARGAAGGPKPGLLGYVDAASAIAALAPQTADAIACVKLLAPVSRVAIGLDADPSHVGGRLAFDIGPASAGVAANLLPEPEGFAAVARTAPLAIEWNADLFAVRTWAAPCMRALEIDIDFERLDSFGVRAGRAALVALDPDAKSGSGVVALDLTSAHYFEGKLDDIPLRSALERKRTYGPLHGHALSVPLVATVDYVLTDKLALAAVGDGLLARVVGSGKVVRGPVAALDVAPPALSAEAWQAVLEAVDNRAAARVVERLLRWRDIHVALTLDGTSLVLSAAGDRR